MNTSVITVAVTHANPFAREGMINVLNRNSTIKVIYEAYNGDDLIRLLAMRSLTPDIVVLDADCRFAEIYAAQIKLVEKYPSVKTITILGNHNDYAIMKMIEAGAMACVIENNNVAAELISAISCIANNKPYYEQIDKALVQKAKANRTPDLTDKELQFLAYCCKGFSVKEIAAHMRITVRTADYYYKAVCSKLGVNDNRIKLVVFAIKTGIVSIV